MFNFVIGMIGVIVCSCVILYCEVQLAILLSETLFDDEK
jgi:hypothetical protein|nr:MAG TPA: hypothetical protein [Caudoviricetes sp.]